jgi:hypothetical protein
MTKKPNISVKPAAKLATRFVTPAMCFTKA